MISASSLRLRRSSLIGGILLFSFLFLFSMHGQRFESFSFNYSDGSARPIELPFLERSYHHGTHEFTIVGQLHRNFLSPVAYHIVPDDQVIELEVNGVAVSLADIPHAKLKDVELGFSINLQSHLKTGKNTIKIVIRDTGGDRGFNIQAYQRDKYRVSLIILLFINFIFFGGLILRRQRVPLVQQMAWFLIFLGSAIQIIYIYYYNPVDHIFSDPQRHWEQGTDVLRKDLMTFTDPVLYQVFIAVLAKITLKIPALVFFYSASLALLGKWFWYRFFRELQSSKTIALYGWAAISLLPSWTAIYAYFMQETLMLPLLGAALWATWRCKRKSNAASFALMVLFWVLAGLTRGICIPLAALCCTWLWFEQSDKFKKAWQSSLILLFFLGPLAYRSMEFVELFAPHGMGHLNAIYAMSGKKSIQVTSEVGASRWVHGFSSPSMGAKPFAPFSTWKTQRVGRLNIHIDLSRGASGWQQERAKLGLTFQRYLWITKENLIFGFFAESWPDNNARRPYDRLSSSLRWMWFPLFVSALILLWLMRKRLQGNWLLPSLLAVWLVVQNLIPISVNEGRYRKPMEGLLMANVIFLVAARQNRLRRAKVVKSDAAVLI